MNDNDHELTPEQTRRIGRTVGVLFVLTFVTSIPALLLYDRVLHDGQYVLGGGNGRSRVPRSGARAAPDRGQHRDRGRRVPGPEAAARRCGAGLRHGPGRRVHLHRRRHPQRPLGGDAAAGRRRRSGHACGDRRRAGGDQGLDVPARAGIRRGRGERDPARLPAVPIRPGAPADGPARSRRWPPGVRLGHRRAVRRPRARRCRAARRDDPGDRLGGVARHLPDGKGFRLAPAPGTLPAARRWSAGRTAGASAG